MRLILQHVGVVLCAALLASVTLVYPNRTQAEVIERVVAVVNDEAIFLSQLRERATPFLERAMQAPTEMQRLSAITEVYDFVLARMVDDELIRQIGEQMQVNVTSAEVDRVIANAQRQNNLSPDQFWEALRGQGMTQEQYRRLVREQLYRNKVINRRVRGRVNITEEQVRQRYNEMVSQARRTAQFQVAHVFLTVAEGANASALGAARRRAAQIREGIVSIEDFEDEMSVTGGGELGVLSQGDLPSELEEVLLTMEEGEISAPVRGPQGFHIFLLRERRQASTQAPTYEASRMEIYQGMMQSAMERQQELFLTELRRDANISMRLGSSN